MHLSPRSIGGRNHFETVGDGTTIIWNHGFFMDRSMFDSVIAQLPGVRHVIWDQRGHGVVDADEPFTYWDSANDAVAILDHLGVESAIFAGWSQGSFIALRAALQAPDRVAGLLLLSASGTPEHSEMADQYRLLADRWLGSRDVADVAEFVADLIIGSETAAHHWKPRWLEYRPKFRRATVDCLLDRDDLTARLHEISCPTVVLHGTTDRAVDITSGVQLAEAIAGSIFIRVDEAPHGLPFAAPDNVASAARLVLDAVSESRGGAVAS